MDDHIEGMGGTHEADTQPLPLVTSNSGGARIREAAARVLPVRRAGRHRAVRVDPDERRRRVIQRAGLALAAVCCGSMIWVTRSVLGADEHRAAVPPGSSTVDGRPAPSVSPDPEPSAVGSPTPTDALVPTSSRLAVPTGAPVPTSSRLAVPSEAAKPSAEPVAVHPGRGHGRGKQKKR